MQKFNCKITHDENILEILNKQYNWIPGPKNIRPTQEIKDKKFEYLNNGQNLKEFILKDIFNLDISKDLRKKVYILKENKFPYQVPEGTLHYVFWSYNIYKTDLEISEIIFKEFSEVNKRTDFEFIFFRNPKMSLELDNINHFQVFIHFLQNS